MCLKGAKLEPYIHETFEEEGREVQLVSRGLLKGKKEDVVRPLEKKERLETA